MPQCTPYLLLLINGLACFITTCVFFGLELTTSNTSCVQTPQPIALKFGKLLHLTFVYSCIKFRVNTPKHSSASAILLSCIRSSILHCKLKVQFSVTWIQTCITPVPVVLLCSNLESTLVYVSASCSPSLVTFGSLVFNRAKVKCFASVQFRPTVRLDL